MFVLLGGEMPQGLTVVLFGLCNEVKNENA